MSQPNVLFLLTDQLRYDAVGACGAPICKTPAIDSIAATGVQFDRAYTPIALCSPARASILTGQYPHNHGQLANLDNFNGVFDQQLLDSATWTSRLHAAGYQVGYVGKWHLPAEGDGTRWGVDRWHTYADWHDWLEMPGYDVAERDVQRLEWGAGAPFAGRASLPAAKMKEAWTADRSVDLIHQFAGAGDRPFAVIASFFGPHFPYAVPEPYDSLYDPANVPRPASFDERFEGKPPIQEKELLRWNAAHLSWSDWQRIIATYWGYCTFIDDQIRRVLDALDETGAAEQTLVIFSADHGDMLGSHRLFNKGFHMYEETHHVPLLVRPPGGTSGSRCNEFVSLVDLAPTLVELCGAGPLPEADGRSLAPFLAGQVPPSWPTDAYAEFHGYETTLASTRMLRTENWKYVYNPASIDELYDLGSDPAELHNLAQRTAFKHVLRRMKARLLERLRLHGDSLGEENSWQSNSYDLFVSKREA